MQIESETGRCADDRVLAKAFLREHLRVWRPLADMYPTLGDLFGAANENYDAENRAVGRLARKKPSFARYADICSLLRATFSTACANHDRTLTGGDFMSQGIRPLRSEGRSSGR